MNSYNDYKCIGNSIDIQIEEPEELTKCLAKGHKLKHDNKTMYGDVYYCDECKIYVYTVNAH